MHTQSNVDAAQARKRFGEITLARFEARAEPAQ